MKYKFFPYCFIVNVAFAIDIAPIFLIQEDQLIIENPENIDSTSDSNFERFDSVNLSSETGEQSMSSAFTM